MKLLDKLAKIVKYIVNPAAYDEEIEQKMRRQAELDTYYLDVVSSKLRKCVTEDHIESGRFWIEGLTKRGDISKQTGDILRGILKNQQDMFPKKEEQVERDLVPRHVRKRAAAAEVASKKRTLKLVDKDVPFVSSL